MRSVKINVSIGSMETNHITNQSFTALKRSDTLPPPPTAILCQALNIGELTIEWLAGDGSDRCYYRLRSPETPCPYVLMQLSGKDALALKENGYEWVQIAEILDSHGIYVPKTVAVIPDYAALVIEDYGNVMMESVALDKLNLGLMDELFENYQDAFRMISKFLKLEATADEPWTKRSFSQENLLWELNFFKDEFLEPVVGIHLSKQQRKYFDMEAKKLSKFLSPSSRYFVHRDFHSRNLMFKNDNLAVIDFQDARLGPPSYDLVSLCFDSYVPLPLEKRKELISSFIHGKDLDLDQAVMEDVERTWRPMLLQRQLKAIGSFAYLTLKKKRSNYLKYTAPALETLSFDLVQDPRWPFISHELIQRINEALGHP